VSYLDLPRLHFGGLFYTFPDTINNILRNYQESVPLTGPDGAYLPNALWGPLGIAQWWIQEATVLSVVGPSGDAVTDASGDPVVGTPVVTPSPRTPLKTPDGKGFYDIGKMVDLDPWQQGRSAVFGFRLSVGAEDGDGFGGAVTVPELQYLVPRADAKTGSWKLVGTWLGRIEEVDWRGSGAGSSFLQALRDASSGGLAVRLAVDLHQNSPASRNVSGNNFCFGRVLGTIGPARQGEVVGVMPPRQILTAPDGDGTALFSVASPESDAAEDSAAPSFDELLPRTLEEVAESLDDAPTAADGAKLFAASAEAASLAPWNVAAGQVQTVGGSAFLHVDLGASIQVGATAQGSFFASDGRFVVDTGITVGTLASDGAFEPLTHDGVDFSGSYVPLDSIDKKVDLVRDSGVVTIPLSADEASTVGSRPLAVQVGSTRVLEEAADGLYVASSPLSLRLTPGESERIALTAHRFGEPTDVTPGIHVLQVTSNGMVPSSDVTVVAAGSGAPGVTLYEVTATAADVPLPPDRQPLDSLMYYVVLTDSPSSRTPIGDGGASLSVLRFANYTAPADPTWDDDVGPVFEAYAHLYPGMKERLDIGDEATVRGFAGVILERLSVPFEDPAYMPVTRDLSPDRMAMLRDWLKSVATVLLVLAAFVASACSTTGPEMAPKAPDEPMAMETPDPSTDGGDVPYSLSLDGFEIPGLPGLHSFAVAGTADRLLLIAGRTNGLHGFAPSKQAAVAPSFPRAYANDTVYLVDLPGRQLLGQAKVTDLPSPYDSQLQSSNTQYAQVGDFLYLVGGYGPDPNGTSLITLPLLTAIDVPALADAVESGTALDATFAASHMNSVTDLNLAVTGGDLQILGGQVLLVYGHRFDGEYTPGGGQAFQEYTNQVRVFDVTASRDGSGVTVTADFVGSVPPPSVVLGPENPYHRRDLNVHPALAPDGTRRVGVYGGVFKGGRIEGFVHPIYVTESPASPGIAVSEDTDAVQLLSQYDGGLVQLYSKSAGTAYTTLYGGISQYWWDPSCSCLKRDVTDISKGIDSLPFIDSVSTFRVTSGGSAQFLHQGATFPPSGAAPACATTSGGSVDAGFLGAETRLVLAAGIPTATDGVVDLDAVTSKSTLGWLVGGIAAWCPDGVLNCYAASHGGSCASNVIYQVTLDPATATPTVRLAEP
jgi:hypothetical protein